MEKIRVLLADDHTIVRQGLRVLLEAEPDIAVVAEAETGRQAVQLAREHKPDVIVMDIAMPTLNGLEATRAARMSSDDMLFPTQHRRGAGYADAVKCGDCDHFGRRLILFRRRRGDLGFPFVALPGLHEPEAG